MNRGWKSRVRTLSLGLLNMGFALLVAFEVSSMSVLNHEPAEPQPSEDLMPDMPAHNIEAPPIEDYAVMLSRPLFNSDRLPRAMTEESGSGDETAPALIGIVLTPEQQVVILRSAIQKAVVRAKLWDWVDGWRIIEVQADRVTLHKGSLSMELQLERQSQPNDGKKTQAKPAKPTARGQ